MAVVTLTHVSLILDPAVKEIECIHVSCDARKVWWRQIAMATEEMVKHGWCNFMMEKLGGTKKLTAHHISVYPDSQHASGYYRFIYFFFFWCVIRGLIWNIKAEVCIKAEHIFSLICAYFLLNLICTDNNKWSIRVFFVKSVNTVDLWFGNLFEKSLQTFILTYFKWTSICA